MNDNSTSNRWLLGILAVVVVMLAVLIACGAGTVGGYLIARRQFDEKLQTLITEPQPRQVPVVPQPPEFFSDDSGALVQEVVPDTPAAGAGLRPGDLIVAVDDAPVSIERSLSDLITQYAPGDRVTITYIPVTDPSRTHRDVVVVLAENTENPGLPLLGIRFVPFFPGMEPELPQND